VVSQERVVEAAGAVLDEVLAGLVLQPGDRAGWVGPEEVAFQAVSVSDRDATYLGMALMRSR
jgi:hypothetical protein